MEVVTRRKALILTAGLSLGGLVAVAAVRHLPQIQWRTFTETDEKALLALLAVILPSGLTAGDLDRQRCRFQQWLAEYPVQGERYHMQDEYIWFKRGLHLPPSPAQTYSHQLGQLQQEANQLHGRDFGDLSRDQQIVLITSLLSDVRTVTLPDTPQGHLIVDLLCLYYRDPAVVDTCFGKKIGYRTCRGLGDVGSRPGDLI